MGGMLGVYWSPWHRRQSDYDYIKNLNPNVIKIMDGGGVDYARARQLHPSAIIVARDWALSEQKEDMRKNPVETGKRHAREWRAKIDSMRAQHDIGPDDKLIVLGINEPEIWIDLSVVPYTVAFLDECKVLGLRGGALQLSVGWPGNDKPGSPPNWGPFNSVRDAIKRGNHVLVVHEYWANQGPEENWGWWAGRILSLPASWDVPIIIGECGIDMFVKATSVGQQNRGWRAVCDPVRYSGELTLYASKMSVDKRIIGICPFETDYQSSEWWSFDTEPAHAQIIEAVKAWGGFPIGTPTTGPSQPTTPTTPTVPTTPPPTTPATSKYVWPVDGTISQHWGDNYATYWNKFKIPGHNGLDIAAPTGTPVKVIADGVVVMVDYDADYGNYIRVFHGKFHSFYAHLSKQLVEIGDKVVAGQVIGEVGSTGNSTGPHLHLEIRVGTNDGYYAVTNGQGKGRVDPYTALLMLTRVME